MNDLHPFVFPDNLLAQEIHNFKNAVAGLNGVVWFILKIATANCGYRAWTDTKY